MSEIQIHNLGVKELLRLGIEIVDELKRRSILRTNNTAVGDLGEAIVLEARAKGLPLETNSTSSFDVKTSDGTTIQVKARKGTSGTFSAFRSFEFDIAIFIVFDDKTHEITHAWEMRSSDIVEIASHSGHVNAWIVSISRLKKLDSAKDITSEMRNAFSDLDHGVGSKSV